MYPVTWKTRRYRSLQKSRGIGRCFLKSFEMSILLAKSLKIDAEQFFGIIIPYMSFILELNFFGLNYGIVCPENVDV